MKKVVKEKIEWAKEHKWEILSSVAGVAGCGILVALGVKCSKNRKEISDATMRVLTETDIVESAGINLEPIPIKSLGEVGKYFLKNVPKANDDTLVQVVAYIEKKDLV